MSSWLLTRIGAAQVSVGRGLRRTVDLFYSARELVEENDRRLEAADSDGNGETSPE
jgi:hypothetical protein